MNQIEFMGEKSIRYLSQVLKKQKVKKILLITGRNSYEKSKTKQTISKILKGYLVLQFSNFSVNPKFSDVEKGITLCKRNKFDIVIAVGGGSVIDTAKVVASLSQQSGKSELYVTGKKIIEKPSLPLVAIPTTSGSGSEATKYAVINVGKTKYSLDNHTILPKYVIVDPELTYDLPPDVTATSGIDALCQAIESYWAVNATTESKKYAKKAAKISLKNLSPAVNAPTKKNRSKMSEAAHLAGKAISISRTTACHAISYPFTSYFKIPHGHAVALTLSPMLAFNSRITVGDCNDGRGSEYVRKTIKEILDIFQSTSVAQAQKQIQTLLDSIHLERKLSNLGLRKKDFQVIINNGFTPLRVKNNPRLLTKKSLQIILSSIY